MNEQLQNALAEILTKTLNGVEAGVEFMQSELPDVIEQLLLWYGVKGFILFLLSIGIMLTIVVSWHKWLKHCNSEENSHYDEFKKFMLPFMLALIPSIVSVFTLNLDWLQIWIAPKIWLMEYAAELAK